MNDKKKITPGAEKSISYHNNEASIAYVKASVELQKYNMAMDQVEKLLSLGDRNAAEIVRKSAEESWQNMIGFLEIGFRHKNSAAIAASLAAELCGTDHDQTES